MNPLIRTRLISNVGLSVEQSLWLDRLYDDCTATAHCEAEILGHLPAGLRLADIHLAYAEAEAELRLGRSQSNESSKGVGTMSFQLHHRPARTLIVKEVDPDFFAKNGMELTELASAKALSTTVPPSFSLRTGMSGAKDQG